MTENCENTDKTLCGGTFQVGPTEITTSKYNPSKIGGFGPNEGDTHGDTILEPCCPPE